jgi:NADH-quinone oxidoreductase subunit E
MSDREPVNLGYPYVESFHSDFSGTGGVDQTDRSTNIDEHTIEEMHQIASRYPDSRSALLPILHLVQSVDGRISPVGIETAA